MKNSYALQPEVPVRRLVLSPPGFLIMLLTFCFLVADHKGKGKGKVHPRTGHEDPEV